MARPIRLGDTGPDVADVQRRLADLVDPSLQSDGYFGDATAEAVKRFQQARRLDADGLVGAETWRALVEAGYRLGDRLLWHSSTLMRGDDVRALQRRLNQLGFDAGPEDGIFGPFARGASEEFQRNTGLTADGIVGPAMVEALERLQRDHQTGSHGVRAREREWVRTMAGRGLPGSRIVVDPGRGAHDPGHEGPAGSNEATVTWAIATRVTARLSANGAQTLLTRGPATDPSPTERARFANEQAVDMVLSIAVNALHVPTAAGAATYYFGGSQFSSEAGRQLAETIQTALVANGWGPDCRTHPMTWTILRDTRMPAVVVEPAFLSSAAGEAALTNPACQDQLAATLADATARLFAGRVGTASVASGSRAP